MSGVRTLACAALVLLMGLPSCRLVNSILHDEEVVARVGKKMLYKSEVTDLIPNGIPSEDSLRLAMQYINTWASDMVYMDIAEKQLSKTEKDVSKQLETYRRSLLKYRYEQLYVNERLDTTVTDAEINEYYKAHSEDFRLARPIVRACYLNMLPESPSFEQIMDLMSSSDEDALSQAAQLAAASSDVFSSYSDSWVDITVFAQDMGVDYQSLIPVVTDTFIQTDGQNGKKNVGYVMDVTGAGQIPPVEYCTARIKDILISARKHQLTESLEQELLNDARDKGKFVIY